MDDKYDVLIVVIEATNSALNRILDAGVVSYTSLAAEVDFNEAENTMALAEESMME